ncbi:MAG: PfkB family carbohydrate kinase [Bacteroidota bacterium]|nr:PfkB family carbohydrate kinase [Bacteroidota bacterium]
MNKVLIVGSIGLDSLKTPFGEKDNVLGGSVSYASIAASLFSKVNMVGVVGEDFPQKYIDLFKSRSINTNGLEFRSGNTFKWSGYYEYDMNQAHTVDTQLNVFADFNPVLPDEYLDSEFVFLANIHPSLQLKVLDQIKYPKFIMLDTMNLWISTTKNELLEVIKRVNLVLLNDGEARQLCGTPNLVVAAKKVLDMGPEYVVIKKGEHGALLFSKSGEVFSSPAYPIEIIKDPTGAGDTFAGGFIGYLSQVDEINNVEMRKAIVIGSTLASYTAEEFSLDKLKTITLRQLNERYCEFESLAKFESLDLVPVS